MTQGDRQRGWEFGNYEVFELLGEGGVGAAYVARAIEGQHARELVCLKMMRRTMQAAKWSERRDAIRMLRHEARVVSQLHHPNIARLLDSGSHNDLWFLAFELIEGTNLGDILVMAGGSGLKPELVRRIGLEIAAALSCAHEHDVLHRDVKPSNILIGTDGQVKLVDFGVAKVNAAEASDHTRGVGTPRYWAPEQIREEAVTPRTDIYALGLVLYELLTGVHPFDDEDPIQLRKKILGGRLPDAFFKLELPQDLVSIIECCLRTDPASRFHSARALQTALLAGAKAAGFTYEMGELAIAARDKVGEFRRDYREGEGGTPSQSPTVPHSPLEPTQGQAPTAMAAAIEDGLPSTMEAAARDEVLRDLRVLGRQAYEDRQRRDTSHGRRRQTTAAEVWDTDSAADPSEPDDRRRQTGLEAEAEGDARRRTVTTLEVLEPQPGSAPATKPEMQSLPELGSGAAGNPSEPSLDEPSTPRRRSRKTVRGFTNPKPAGDSSGLIPEPGSGRERAATLPTAAQGKRARVALWTGLTATMLLFAVAALVLWPSSKPNSRHRAPPLSEPEHRAAVRTRAPSSPTEQRPETAAPATAAFAPKSVLTSGPTQAPAAPTPVQEPGSRKPTSSARVGKTNHPPIAQEASAQNDRELITVTVGLIPYGEVEIDGKLARQAPVFAKLRPGPHRIVARNRLRRVEKNVVVTAETHLFVLDLRDAP
jgi:hypothetical protein